MIVYSQILQAIKLKFVHIKGHQDNTIPIHKLSIPAQHNVLMDKIAKNMRADHTNAEALILQPHKLSFTLPKHKGRFIQQDFKRELYKLVMEEKAHQCWIQEKNRYKKDDIERIDWEAQTAAMRSIQTTKQRSLVKWFSG